MPGSKPFAKPIKIADKNYTHFEMRESTVEDMFDAELELAKIGGGVNTPLQFNGELMVRQLIRVSNDKGDHFDGPFTMNMLKQWGNHNYSVLRNEQAKVDALGEGLESETTTP